tara:strand:- start:1238 stop:1390 length:153 start_codon:yes stop_codon:yes gene_type:complete
LKEDALILNQILFWKLKCEYPPRGNNTKPLGGFVGVTKEKKPPTNKASFI